MQQLLTGRTRLPGFTGSGSKRVSRHDRRPESLTPAAEVRILDSIYA